MQIPILILVLIFELGNLLLDYVVLVAIKTLSVSHTLQIVYKHITSILQVLGLHNQTLSLYVDPLNDINDELLQSTLLNHTHRDATKYIVCALNAPTISSRALRLAHHAKDCWYCPKVITLHYDDIITIK